MNDDLSELLSGIGPRLREFRHARGMTLALLAERTGLSVSLLSRLETGHRAPSLDALIPLARTYRLTLDRLIGLPDTGDPRIHLRPRRSTSGGVVVPLTSAQGRLTVFKHVLGPRAPRLISHAGRAWLFVLSGELTLILGSETHLLRAGETAEFDGMTPHWFGPVTDSVELLHLFGPSGDAPEARVVHTRAP